MDATLTGALIGFSGSVLVSFIANFCAEDYRRHRDSHALAGALAGELSSYKDAWPELRAGLEAMLVHARSGVQLVVPKIPKPVDRVFEANVARLGLLEPALSEEIAYVYNQINAFRELFRTLIEDSELSADQQAARIHACITTLDRAATRAETLPQNLRTLSKSWYVPFRT
jgi:hypothetical protein